MSDNLDGSVLITERTASVLRFYKTVFPGWDIGSPGDPRDWVHVDSGPGRGGTIMNQEYAVEPMTWIPCVQVKSISSTLEEVLENHGSVVLGEKPFPDGDGTYAIIADPKGANLVLHQPRKV